MIKENIKICYKCLLIFASSPVVDVFFQLLKATSQILSDAATLRIKEELHRFFSCLYINLCVFINICLCIIPSSPK